MRWNIQCVGCGQTLQVGPDQLGRILRCPDCHLRLPVEPPPRVPSKPVVAVDPSRRPRPGWLLLGAAGAMVLIGMAISAAFARWSSINHNTSIFGGPQVYVPTLPMLDEEGRPGMNRAGERLLDTSHAIEVRFPESAAMEITSLTAVAKVPNSLAIASDVRTGRLLSATRDGRLAWFDTKSWEPLGFCQLGKPAYHLLVDAKQGLLFAACTPPEDLSQGKLGDRDNAAGELRVYELNALWKEARGGEPTPLHVLDVNAHITGMLLSPDGQALYYTAEARQDAYLGLIHTPTWKSETILWGRGGAVTSVALAPDAPVLYALTGSRLYSIDSRSGRILDRVTVSGASLSVVAAKYGRVYLVERRNGIQIQVVDVAGQKLLARWLIEADGRPYLRVSPGGDRLYLGTSAVTSGGIWAFDVSGASPNAPVWLAYTRSDPHRVLRAGLFTTSEGEWLVTGTGHVFRAPTLAGQS